MGGIQLQFVCSLPSPSGYHPHRAPLMSENTPPPPHVAEGGSCSREVGWERRMMEVQGREAALGQRWRRGWRGWWGVLQQLGRTLSGGRGCARMVQRGPLKPTTVDQLPCVCDANTHSHARAQLEGDDAPFSPLSSASLSPS